MSGAVDSFNFNSQELAIMCSSHMGEKIHTDIVNGMIEKMGLSADDLNCGVHVPFSDDVARDLIINKIIPNKLHNNCSGKHAGMLALTKHLKYEINNYTNQNHPTQKTILKYVSDVIGQNNIPLEVDGCSAVTPFLTIETIASLYQKLGSGQREELNRVYKSMIENPTLIGGLKNFDTHFIKTMMGKGLTKIGGESVRGVVVKTKDRGTIGLAIKILDGNSRALPIVTIKLLEHLNLLSDNQLKKLNDYNNEEIKNHNGDKVGRIEAHLEF
jgi:L-asparaginase II